MKTFPIPTKSDQAEFLFHLYFGDANDGDYLRLCIDRAYLDLCRTLHGIRQVPNSRKTATDLVRRMLDELKDGTKITTQETFDEWHQNSCTGLRLTYAKLGYADFYVGQAQKWLNMSLKYIYVFGEERLSGYKRIYQFCHAPLDEKIISYFQAQYGAPKLSTTWSRLKDYNEYLTFQQWIRVTFENSASLAVEFHLWPEAKRYESAK